MRTPNEPNIIVMYIIAGIAAIIIFTFLVIVIVICLLKKKTRFGSETSNEQLNTETMSKRGSLYNGFSIDEFDTEKINQLNYYNSLRQVKPLVEASEGSEGSIQRNLDYCIPDLAEYRESDGVSSSPPSSRRADPTYARPVPKAQRAKNGKVSSGSPLTISEQTLVGSPVAESDTYEYIPEQPTSSAEPIYRSILKKVPPPTLPKSVAGLDVTVTPRPPDLVTVLDLVPPSPSSNSLPDTESQMSPTDKRVRSPTQV